jgi:hypothetical protein
VAHPMDERQRSLYGSNSTLPGALERGQSRPSVSGESRLSFKNRQTGNAG